MPELSARRHGLSALFVAAAAVSACSLAFPVGDLTAGAGGNVGAGGGGGAGSEVTGTQASVGPHGSTSSHTSSTGTHGQTTGSAGGATTTGTSGACTSARSVRRRRPVHGRQLRGRRVQHEIAVGATCSAGTDCTPPGTCTAAGVCAHGQPDDAACDDGNGCTIDTCEIGGCAHTPRNGAACNDGNACDGPGTCDTNGSCVATAIQDTGSCSGNFGCPGGFYPSDYHCDTSGFCGECPFCVNAIKCSYACLPTFDACCNIGDGDCSVSCPAGWHVAAGPFSSPTCGCGGAAPGTAVTCSR